MGSPISQVQAPQTGQPQGKGFAASRPSDGQLRGDFGDPQYDQNMMSPAVIPQPQGKGGRVTYPGQSGQPRIGQPNNYSNTVGPWDNASIGQSPSQTFTGYTQPSQRNRQGFLGGKGKGA